MEGRCTLVWCVSFKQLGVLERVGRESSEGVWVLGIGFLSGLGGMWIEWDRPKAN